MRRSQNRQYGTPIAVCMQDFPQRTVRVMWNDDAITPAVLLSHIRVMQSDISSVNTILSALEIRMDNRFTQMDQRMDRMEANLTRQIDAIDKRLDAIEIVNLPRRVTALEHAMQKR